MFKKINPKEISENAVKKVIEIIQSNLFQYILIGHAILYFIFMIVLVIGLALNIVR